MDTSKTDPYLFLSVYVNRQKSHTNEESVLHANLEFSLCSWFDFVGYL